MCYSVRAVIYPAHIEDSKEYSIFHHDPTGIIRRVY